MMNAVQDRAVCADYGAWSSTRRCSADVRAYHAQHSRAVHYNAPVTLRAGSGRMVPVRRRREGRGVNQGSAVPPGYLSFSKGCASGQGRLGRPVIGDIAR